MTSDHLPIDRLLAAALRGDGAGWPSDWSVAATVERIAYQGISGLIADRAASLTGWPADVLAFTRDQAIAQAMWEMRHKQVLGDVLDALASAGISAFLLKGTALAYDLYPAPATRARGDSDLLISPADLPGARAALIGLGFQRLDAETSDDHSLQEEWGLTCDAGTTHHIDLHWQLLNAPALGSVLDFATCAANPHQLPRLGPNAMAMNRVLTLLHTCVHRAMHLSSPYFVNGITYYGGDRLIWASDIDLLAGALSSDEWDRFARMAREQGIAAVCLDGLRMAQRSLGTVIPLPVLEKLEPVRNEPASAYLLNSGQAGRAWADLRAMPGWKPKLDYLLARVLPSENFMRAKYADQARRPLAFLHLKRMIDLVRPRMDRDSRA